MIGGDWSKNNRFNLEILRKARKKAQCTQERMRASPKAEGTLQYNPVQHLCSKLTYINFSLIYKFLPTWGFLPHHYFLLNFLFYFCHSYSEISGFLLPDCCSCWSFSYQILGLKSTTRCIWIILGLVTKITSSNSISRLYYIQRTFITAHEPLSWKRGSILIHLPASLVKFICNFI